MSADERRARSLEVLTREWPDEPSFDAAEAAWLHAELLDATSQPIIAVDLDRTVTYWNRAAEEMYGWSAIEAMGRPVSDVMGRDQPPDEAAAIYEAMLRGASWSGDFEVERRDGTELLVHVTNRPVFDRHGALVAVISVGEDVAKRNANEDARRRLAAIVESSGDAIFGATTDGTITSWNAAAQRLFGYTSAEVIGQPVSLFASADYAEQHEQMRARLAAGGEPERVETVGVRKDGSRIEVFVTASPTKDGSGNVLGLSVVAHDISERHAVQRALEASERRLSEAQRTAEIGSFEFAPASAELTWSDELYRIFGLDVSVVPTGAVFVAMVHPDDRLAVRQAWANWIAHGGPMDIEFRIVRADGEQERCVRARAVADLAEDGTVLRLVGTMMDDTERVEAERVRLVAERRFESSFEQSGIGAVIADLDGIPVRVNAAVCALLDRPAEELVGQRWASLGHPDDVPLGHMVLARLAEGHDTYHDERRYFRPDGSVVWVSTYVTLVRDEMGEPQYLSAQLQDLTERKRLEEELSHRSLHDMLTGLPNRVLLIDRLSQTLAGSRRRDAQLTVMVLNVDLLQAVNDDYGRDVGDELLRHVAVQIEGAVRPGDTVARSGGDEFTILCDGASVVEAEQVARRILAAVSEPWHGAVGQVSVTASVGISRAHPTATPESLLRDAGETMHRAKERGRGRVELFDEARRGKSERRITASALRGALTEGEFIVHYQPVVDLTTGAMISAEALLRWASPDHGLVGPDQFIPLAEETGLIVPIGAWVLEEACAQLVEWQRTDPAMTVAVNLSVRQITAPNIAEMIQDVLARTGLSPRSLCLEVTESVFMDDVEYFAGILSSLKALGVQLAIDDFGTGYSSLSYLKRFPVDAVKVDRSFVDGLGTDPHASALVAAMIAMADALALEVTAEGVENAPQLLDLERLHCGRAQGFYLARPMPAADVTRLVVEAKRWPIAHPPRLSSGDEAASADDTEGVGCVDVNRRA